MGDCRATVSYDDGRIKMANQSVVDGAFPERGVVHKGVGAAQTPIHAMLGKTVWRDEVPKDARSQVVCTIESMGRKRIDNDHNDEAFDEWCNYNLWYCANRGIDPESKVALEPRKDKCSPAIRLCPCDTQPTRGVKGINEQVVPHGQTWRYDISLEECGREKLMIGVGCDGVEDNRAVTFPKIMACVSSLDKFKAHLDDENLLHKSWLDFESYHSAGGFRDKVQWMGDHSDSIKVQDEIWKSSIERSARVLTRMIDDETLEYAFRGISSEQLDLRCKAFVELVNLCASGDNVTFGLCSFGCMM